MFDYIVKNARVIDPESGFDSVASVAVKDGVIAEIGENISAEAGEIIDGTGCVLAPGFIDIHAHEDAFPQPGVFILPIETAKAAQKEGVTTLVTGNCGLSSFPMSDYRRELEAAGLEIHTPFYVGNVALRFAVGLDYYQTATPQQIARMAELEAQAFADGAVGISFGLQYAPGTGFEEILALAKVAAAHGKLMSVHMRYDYPEKAIETVREVIDAAEQTGVSLQISHLAANVYGGDNIARVAEMIEASPADIACDMYPYNVWATDIASAVFDDGFEQFNFDVTDVEILTGEYAGQYCTQALFEKMRANKENALCACHNAMPPEDIEACYLLPYCMLGSDSQLCRDESGVYMGHPRSSSAAIKFLCDYVQTGKMSLRDGLAKLTCLPAKKLGFAKKGRLQVGMDADLVLFKPEALKVNATFGPNVCQTPPSGICRVFIAKN